MNNHVRRSGKPSSFVTDVDKLLVFEDSDRGLFSADTDDPLLQSYHLSGQRLAEEVAAANIQVEDANIVLIKAPKGCGKSVFIKSLLHPRNGKGAQQEAPSALVIVHRRSLATDLASRWQLDCYLDDDSNGPTRRFVCSLDSLWQLDKKAPKYEVIVLDEAEQIFRHLLSDTLAARREQIFRVFKDLIDDAKLVICSDADLTSELTGYWMSKLRSNFESDKIISVHNEWPANRDIQIYESKQHLVADLLCAISDGQRVYVPVGELKLAKELKNLVDLSRTLNGENISVLLLTGETSDEEQAKSFFKDPNGESKKYSVLISTSTLSTGVSIDVAWFDAVYGIFDRNVYTYQDCDQAISRVRSCPIVKVWIHQGIKGKYSSEQAIRSGPVLKERLTRSLISLDAGGKLSHEEERFMDVYARTQWQEQLWKQNRLQQFCDLKKREGWHIAYVAPISEFHSAGTELLKIGNDPAGDKKFLQIFEADNLSAEEFAELREKKNLRGRVARSVTKFFIAQTFGVKSPAHLTLSQITAYFENDVRNVIKNAKLLRATKEQVIARDRYERTDPNRSKSLIDFDHRAMKRKILSDAQKITGISLADVLEKAKLYIENEQAMQVARQTHEANSRAGRVISKAYTAKRDELRWIVEPEMISRLASYAAQDLKKINTYFSTSFKSPTAPETQMKIFNSIMGEIGVKLKKRRGKGAPQYYIDYERVSEMALTLNPNDFAC